MDRCDYCVYRNSWDCEDWRISNDCLCENFKLDFDTLDSYQKKAVQKRLMKGADDEIN